MPDSPVLAGLAWQSGGFTFQYCPVVKKVNATLAVSGVAFDVRHEWLKDQECIAGSITNMTGSFIWRKEQPQIPAMMAVTVETDVSAEMKLSRVQDLLCFKAIWIDSLGLTANAAVVNQSEQKSAEETGLQIQKVGPRTKMTQLMLLRIRKLEIVGDITVSRVVCRIEPLTIRVRRTPQEEHFRSELGHLRISGAGIISGTIRNQLLALEAMRYPRSRIAEIGSMLHLSIRADTLLVDIQHEGQPFGFLR